MGEKKVWIEGIGYCKESIINRVNDLGIEEPYVIYTPINDINDPNLKKEDKIVEISKSSSLKDL